MDDGILVVESWLMSATEYMFIDNTLLRTGVHVDQRSGLARHDQLVDHDNLKSLQPFFVLIVSSANTVMYHIYIRCSWV